MGYHRVTPSAKGKLLKGKALDSEKTKQKRTVMQSARAMALGTLSSRVLGFVRDAVFFALFPKTFTDAYSVAFKLPNLFRRVLGEGSLGVSFVPLYINSRQSRALADGVFSALLAVTVTLSLLAIIFMNEIVNGLVGDPMGYAAVAGKIELTVELARIMMGYLVLVALYAFYTAIANTRDYFFLPSVGPTLFNVVCILFFLLAWGVSQQWAAWGVLLGGIVQAGLVAWVLWRDGALPRWTWAWRGVGVMDVVRGMAPGLFGMGLFQVLTLVNTRYAASVLEEGAQSYLYAADRVLELPQSLLAVSLGSVLLPRFSEWVASGNRAALLSEATRGVRVFLFLALPAAIGMSLLSDKIVSVLFERGSFGGPDVLWTSAIVEEYAALLIFAGLSRVTAPVFYAMRNLWLPAFVALVVLVVHILACPFFLSKWGLAGLAACTSFSSFVNFLLLQIGFHRLVGSLKWGEIFMAFLRWLPGLLLLAGVAALGPGLLNRWPVPLALFTTIAVAIAVYFGCGWIFRSSEFRQFYSNKHM